MKFKKKNFFTPGTRHQFNIQKNLLCKYNKFVKNLSSIINGKGGRNKDGRITVRHQGSGVKSSFHVLEKKVERDISIILSVLYSSNKSSFVSLNFDLKKKVFFKKNSTEFMFSGFLVSSNNFLKEFRLGFCTKIKYLPLGSIFHSIITTRNIEYANSAGTFCQLLNFNGSYCSIRLPSNFVKNISVNSLATLGIAANSTHNLTKIGKAGRNRLKGIRPSVRGIAMNPVDHPHGGRTNGGMIPSTPWGKPTKGKITVFKR